MNVRAISQKLALLVVFLLIIIVDAHVVGNQVMTVFHRHFLFPIQKTSYHRAELRPLVLQSIHIGGEYRTFPLPHVEPDVSRNNTRVTRLINDVEIFFLQGIAQ